MSVRTCGLGVWLALLAASVAWVPNAVAADTVKIGVVDFQRCLAESKMGKKFKAQFKDQVTQLRSQLDKEEAELKSMRVDLDKQGLVLSETARNEKEREYQDRLKAFSKKVETTQQAIRRKDVELTSKIFEALQPIIRDIGQTGGYTLIVEKQEGGVLYAPGQLDLTEEVIRRYDESVKAE